MDCNTTGIVVSQIKCRFKSVSRQIQNINLTFEVAKEVKDLFVSYHRMYDINV